MTQASTNSPVLQNGATHTINFRVEYHETDGQGHVHHSRYASYFERGRVEMLRSAGLSYKRLEEAGFMLVVTEINVKYHAPSGFDDVLTMTTELTGFRKVRLYHRYRIERDGLLIVEGTTTIACVDHQGQPRRLPSHW
ncbi:acyl-CoA thioesterase [Novipirellula artificiosorum]|uniref:Acyl-CoA thioester hydrolase YbgC n=1 Tax=Novipirellula artificiosorum TaxID=2528016 RepID=A0A5C6D2I3_9BACT|nr:thioesterase family protein [Novipirellula artificiosorum]TWU30948.1 Acyl-CoA thioester hydrolase YbgC [Novipirellula artificiosorum]